MIGEHDLKLSWERCRRRHWRDCEKNGVARDTDKDTKKLHNVIAIREDVIDCRLYGTSPSKWAVFF
jgi:hypothetical protein